MYLHIEDMDLDNIGKLWPPWFGIWPSGFDFDPQDLILTLSADGLRVPIPLGLNPSESHELSNLVITNTNLILINKLHN
jgi:hypothetical protein